MQDMQAFNRALIEEFRANGGKLSGQMAKSTLLLLTTTGAKSGTERVTPLGFAKDGERLIVIAANAGAPAHPDWYYNLLAHPDVTVEVGAERFAAHATTAATADRERLIALIPYFHAQQEKTTRVIPIVILERVGVA
ncbi:MAG: nitroreductase family deazaflavin-dependent oxidoreductase [Ktedonobacterales bacterium]|nr:nitroreductase family deazaflavin-dependent oxidoreductase [Ktedonobacterales bacterium]